MELPNWRILILLLPVLLLEIKRIHTLNIFAPATQTSWGDLFAYEFIFYQILHTLHTLSIYLFDNQQSNSVYAIQALVYAKVFEKRNKTLGFTFVPGPGNKCPSTWDK